MIRIAVCDDEKLERERISRAAETFFDTRGEETGIRLFSSANELLNARGEFDLYLLDVLMPEKDGISAAEELKEQKPDAVIVFITSMIDSAVDSYRVEAAGFLLKPVMQEQFDETMERLLRRGRIGQESVLGIIYNHMPMDIPLKDIVCIESELHRVHIRLDGDCYSVRMRLKDIEEKLSGREEFLRCHQSFIVNLNYVARVDANELVLQDGVKAGMAGVPISRNYLKSSKKAFFDFRLKNKGADVSAP